MRRYCRTSFWGKKLHIAREWQDGWQSWCGKDAELEEEPVYVTEKLLCKHCLKKYKADQEAKQ